MQENKSSTQKKSTHRPQLEKTAQTTAPSSAASQSPNHQETINMARSTHCDADVVFLLRTLVSVTIIFWMRKQSYHNVYA